MESAQKTRKKRTRWGADLDDEVDDLPEHVEPEEPPRDQAAPEDVKITSPKRKKSRWGGDKVPEDGLGVVDEAQNKVNAVFKANYRAGSTILIHTVSAWRLFTEP